MLVSTASRAIIARVGNTKPPEKLCSRHSIERRCRLANPPINCLVAYTLSIKASLTPSRWAVDPLASLLVPNDAEFQLQDGPQLFHIDESVAEVPEERLLLGKDEVLLLTSITRAPAHFSTSFDGVDLDPRRVQKMKLELPLLTSDHEIDMQRFVRVIIPDLANEHLPLESLDEEADEGLSWPSRDAALPDVYSRKNTNEKLEVSPVLLSYMCNTLDYGDGITKHLLFEDVELPAKKVQLLPLYLLALELTLVDRSLR